MMTRRKIFEVRVTLPITADLLALVDDALEPDEYRVDFIRNAIKRELARRQRSTHARKAAPSKIKNPGKNKFRRGR